MKEKIINFFKKFWGIILIIIGGISGVFLLVLSIIKNINFSKTIKTEKAKLKEHEKRIKENEKIISNTDSVISNGISGMESDQ